MRSSKSCDRCHRLKQACRGNSIPCESCEKFGYTCSFDRPLQKVGRPKIEVAKTMIKKQDPKRRNYSHNGCFSCRKRKKKCDEKVPVCGSCEKLNIQCQRRIKENPPSLKQAKVYPEIESAMESEISAMYLTSPDPLSPSMMLSPLVKKFEMDDLIPLLSLSSSDLTFNYKEKMFLNSLMDVSSITDSNLKDNNISSPCISVISSEVSDDLARYEEEKHDLIDLCNRSASSVLLKELELLKYFITDISSLLFADKTTNRILKTVIPLCLRDHRVRYPVIAIASSNKANCAKESNYELERDKAVFRAKAQSCFIEETSDYSADTENVLLSILLICIMEIFEGNSLYWSMALGKAATIIHQRGGFKKLSKISPLSIQLFCYLDLISSLSTCSTPFVERTQGESNPYSDYEGDHIEDLLNSKFGFKFGIAGELFKIVGNISTLASLRLKRYDSSEREKQFNLLANLIEMKLQNWSPPAVEASNLDEEDSYSTKLTLSSYTLSLQWSAFLRLHQIRYGYNRKDVRVEACLRIILRSIKAVEVDPDLETGLLFPLIMAGSVASEERDRQYILSRIKNIKNRLKFNYIAEFEKLLEKVWSRDESEGDYVNWAKIRYFEFPGLVMF